MMDRKQRLIEIFQDTQKWYTEDEQLAAAIEASRNATVFYGADDYPPLAEKRQAVCEVTVVKGKTFQTAMDELSAHPERKTAVLNFASATRPGGGVKTGSSAQEESLCRCSTLYPTLDRRFLWQKYYDVNRAAQNPLHTDACIYSPGVIICKTDDSFPERMPRDQWRTVDVISCAAPNLRSESYNVHNPEAGAGLKLTRTEQYGLHVRRARHILHIAAANGVDTLILGAFGCGAFLNDPYAVARAYRDVLPEYKYCFDRIIFAVYCRPYETENYDAFAGLMGNQQNGS